MFTDVKIHQCMFDIDTLEYLGITMDFTFDTTKLSDNEYVGFTGDVEIYTFSYVDRAVDDGAVVGNGTFRAIKCVERTLVEIFRL